jgi:hypothetical protein
MSSTYIYGLLKFTNKSKKYVGGSCNFSSSNNSILNKKDSNNLKYVGYGITPNNSKTSIKPIFVFITVGLIILSAWLFFYL